MALLLWQEGRQGALILLFFIVATPIFSDGVDAPVYREYDFISHVPESPHFVMFFAPWCKHCQKLDPLWNRLAQYFGKSSSPVTIAKVDCTQDTPLCAQEDIKAYPTMRYFDQGKKATYRGQRDISDIIRFTLQQTEESSKLSTPEDEFEVELDTYRFEKELQYGLKIVNFYAPWCPHCKRLAPTWQKLAEEYRYFTDVKVLQVNCEKEKMICKKHKITGFPKIIAFYQGSVEVIYEGDRSIEHLKEFVMGLIETHLDVAAKGVNEYKPDNQVEEVDSVPSEQVPLEEPEDTTGDEAISLRKETFDLAVSNGKTFIYFYAPWCKYCKQFSPIWDKLAKEVIEKRVMVKIAKVDCTIEEDLCQELKVTSFPTIRLFKSRFNVREYNGERTVADLMKFINQHARDEL